MVTCSERIKLFDAYQKATRAYSEAVARLHQAIGTSSKADYDVLYHKAEALRMDAVEAQNTLNVHVAKHSC